MASVLRAGKAAMDHVDKGLKKVQAKSWAEPLGKALEVSGKIVNEMSFLPGVGVIGGALSFGATLLNPQPSLGDLLKELKEIQESLADGSQGKAAIRALLREQKDLEEQIDNPKGELNDDIAEVKDDMKRIYKKIGETSSLVSKDMAAMKDKLGQTFEVVTDHRYRVSKYV